MFGSKELLALSEEMETAETILERVGKEYHILQRQSSGGVPNGTVTGGSIDKWEMINDHVSVTFYDSWRYGGQDWETVSFPITCLDNDDWKAEFAENAAHHQRAKERGVEASRLDVENKERARLEELKAKYPDAQ